MCILTSSHLTWHPAPVSFSTPFHHCPLYFLAPYENSPLPIIHTAISLVSLSLPSHAECFTIFIHCNTSRTVSIPTIVARDTARFDPCCLLLPGSACTKCTLCVKQILLLINCLMECLAWSISPFVNCFHQEQGMLPGRGARHGNGD